MISDFAHHFCSVTEKAALAAYDWLGRGDKNKADQAAVEAMRQRLNQMPFCGEIVIGEGEIDEAPMLFIGEKLGLGGEAIDIAVDPIDGTRMTAMGQSGAVAVLAAAEQGALLKAPDMYMEKLCAGPAGKGVIDIQQSIEANVEAVAKAAGKKVSDMTVATLAKPRHEDQIKRLHAMGVRVFAQPDGDVAASLLTCVEHSEVDLMYCMGGAPEGVISAAAMRAMGGDMQARLVPMTEAKGSTSAAQEAEVIERARCKEMGVAIDTPLFLDQLVSSDQIVFCMTGVTSGELVKGVAFNLGTAQTSTFLVNGALSVQQVVTTDHSIGLNL